jgi:hypothetical protein
MEGEAAHADRPAKAIEMIQLYDSFFLYIHTNKQPNMPGTFLPNNLITQLSSCIVVPISVIT